MFELVLASRKENACLGTVSLSISTEWRGSCSAHVVSKSVQTRVEPYCRVFFIAPEPSQHCTRVVRKLNTLTECFGFRPRVFAACGFLPPVSAFTSPLKPEIHRLDRTHRRHGKKLGLGLGREHEAIAYRLVPKRIKETPGLIPSLILPRPFTLLQLRLAVWRDVSRIWVVALWDGLQQIAKTRQWPARPACGTACVRPR